MNYYERALARKEETIAHRRWFRTNAKVGLHMPGGQAYVLAELESTVKFMFQPAEETFEGEKDMIENGILEYPTPDAALAYHVTSGKMPTGINMYNNTGTMMFSVDYFKITVKGRGSH